MYPVKSGVSLPWKKARSGVVGEGWPAVPALYACKVLGDWAPLCYLAASL